MKTLLKIFVDMANFNLSDNVFVDICLYFFPQIVSIVYSIC